MDYLGLYNGDVFLLLKKSLVTERMNSRWAMHFHPHIFWAYTNSFLPWSCESLGCWDLLSILPLQETSLLSLRTVDPFLFLLLTVLCLATDLQTLNTMLWIKCPLSTDQATFRDSVGKDWSRNHSGVVVSVCKLKVKDLRCKRQMSLG